MTIKSTFLRRRQLPWYLCSSPCPQKRRSDAPFILLPISWAEPPPLAMPFAAWHSVQMLQRQEGHKQPSHFYPDTQKGPVESLCMLAVPYVVIYSSNWLKDSKKVKFIMQNFKVKGSFIAIRNLTARKVFCWALGTGMVFLLTRHRTCWQVAKGFYLLMVLRRCHQLRLANYTALRSV